MKIAVVGLGKVGHPLATVLSEKFHVCGIEKSKEQINSIKGEATYTIYEKPNVFLKDCEVVFIIVQTPSLSSGKFDLQYVEEAIENVSKYLTSKAIIVVCSTINVGDCDKLKRYWPTLVYNPFLIALGRVEADFRQPGFVLIGSDNNELASKVKNIWRQIVPKNTVFHLTSLRDMEIIKLTFNFWLPAKISMLNSTAIFCEKHEGNLNVVVEALKHDKRLAGQRWWNEFGVGAGIGFGGPCFPRDICNWEAHLPDNVLVKAVEEINMQQVERSVELINSLDGNNVAVLGVTYKANTHLTVGSQAIEILKTLQKNSKKNIFVYDPKADYSFEDYSSPKHFETAKEAIEKADIIFIAVPWSEFAELEPCDFKKHQVVIDPWRILLDKKLPCRYYAYGVGWKNE